MSSSERRSSARRFLEGTAYWSASRREGQCGLRNVSTGGAEIDLPSLPLFIGQRLVLTLDLGSGILPEVAATVARTSSGTVAFRFVDPSGEFVAAVEAAMRAQLRS